MSHSIQGRVQAAVNEYSVAAFGNSAARNTTFVKHDAPDMPGPGWHPDLALLRSRHPAAAYQEPEQKKSVDKPAASFASRTARLAQPGHLDTPSPTHYNVVTCLSPCTNSTP